LSNAITCEICKDTGEQVIHYSHPVMPIQSKTPCQYCWLGKEIIRQENELNDMLKGAAEVEKRASNKPDWVKFEEETQAKWDEVIQPVRDILLSEEMQKDKFDRDTRLKVLELHAKSFDEYLAAAAITEDNVWYYKGRLAVERQCIPSLENKESRLAIVSERAPFALAIHQEYYRIKESVSPAHKLMEIWVDIIACLDKKEMELTELNIYHKQVFLPQLAERLVEELLQEYKRG